MSDHTDLGLTVTVPADAWALAQRRLAFLEAVLSQILQDRGRVREWFTARELAALNLPGLSNNPATIGSLAFHRSWARREVRRGGRMVPVYHYASLPQPAFEAFIRQIVRLPDDDLDAPPPPRAQATAEPQWVLPLMRIIKGGAGSWQDAYRQLRPALPPGVPMPPADAVEAAFRRLARR